MPMATDDRDDPTAERSSSTTWALHPITFVYILGGILVVFAAFGLVRSAPRALTTIALGAVFALALDPVVGAVRRAWGWSRPRSVLLVVGGAIVLVSTVVGVMGPQAADQARAISTDLPQTVRQFYDLPAVGGWLEHHDAASRVDQAVRDLPGNISDKTVTSTVEGLIVRSALGRVRARCRDCGTARR
jgi:predicted PurR-regulated permease PerM